MNFGNWIKTTIKELQDEIERNDYCYDDSASLITRLEMAHAVYSLYITETNQCPCCNGTENIHRNCVMR